MGVYLPKPITTKHSEDGGNFINTATRYGLSAMQGWRLHMEDAHLADPAYETDHFKNMGVYAVFDGHGGPAVSAWVSTKFKYVFGSQLQDVLKLMEKNSIEFKVSNVNPYIAAVCEALQRTFLRLDVEMDAAENRKILKFIHEDAQAKKRQEDASASLDKDQPLTFFDLLVSRVNNRKAQSEIEDADKSTSEARIELDDENMLAANESPPSNDSSAAGSPRPSNEHLEGTCLDACVVPKDDGHPATPDVKLSVGELDEIFFGFKDRAVSRVTDESQADQHEPKLRISAKSSAKEPQGTESTSMLNENNSDDPELRHVGETFPSEAKQDAPTEITVEVDAEAAEDLVDDSKDYDALEPSEMGSDQNSCLLPCEDQPESCGSTAIVVVVLDKTEHYPAHLIIANAGDSRAVLSRNGSAVPLSKDHKPVLKGESRRIAKAGGKVVGGRVDGNLNLSRALGDLYYKSNPFLDPEEQKIVAVPDIRFVELHPDDEFVIIACDGIWDCMSNQGAVKFVHHNLNLLSSEEIDAFKLSQICEKMCDLCLAPNPLSSDGGIGCDNMTAMIILLKPKITAKELDTASEELSIDAISGFYGNYCDEDFEESASDMYDEHGIA